MIYIFIATEREKRELGISLAHIIGIGATDMPETTERDIIINIGYCGSAYMKPNTIVEIGTVYSTDETAEPIRLERLKAFTNNRCTTSAEFVELQEGLNRPALPGVFDMELYKIATERKYKRLYAFKIVSDGLNENEYDEFKLDQLTFTAAREALILTAIKEKQLREKQQREREKKRVEMEKRAEKEARKPDMDWLTSTDWIIKEEKSHGEFTQKYKVLQ